MIPKLIINRLPIISSRRMTVAKPVNAVPLALDKAFELLNPTAKRKKIIPANVTRRNGNEENVVIPIKASFARLR